MKNKKHNAADSLGELSGAKVTRRGKNKVIVIDGIAITVPTGTEAKRQAPRNSERAVILRTGSPAAAEAGVPEAKKEQRKYYSVEVTRRAVLFITDEQLAGIKADNELLKTMLPKYAALDVTRAKPDELEILTHCIGEKPAFYFTEKKGYKPEHCYDAKFNVKSAFDAASKTR